MTLDAVARAQDARHGGSALVLALEAMATRFELVIPGAPSPRTRAAGEAALEAILECERRWSRFRRDSLLAHLERHATSRPVRLDQDDQELFAAALDVGARSGGAFDVAGGHADALELDRERGTLRFARPVTLDLGGIAKGHALDLAARELCEAGVASAFLHGGTSSALAIGRPPGARAWRVALADAGGDRGRGGTGRADDPVCVRRGRVIELCDAALSVSAQRGRAHVVDPRTGAAVESRALAWAVAREARVAEAWSTALLVLGTTDVRDERLLALGLEGER